MRTIQHTVTLDYYDGPIVFEGRDRIGGIYIAVAGPDHGINPVYAVVGVSPENLYDFRNGKVDLRTLMLKAGSEEWFLASPNDSTEEFSLEPQFSELDASEYLPGSGYKLDSGISSDVAVLDAAQRRQSLVIELKVEPPESENDHRIQLASLVQLLDLTRKLVSHACKAARIEANTIRNSKTRSVKAPALDVVVPTLPGSFCMLLEERSEGQNSEENELAQGLRRIDSLFDHFGTRNVKLTEQHFRLVDQHLATTYMKLLNFLKQGKVGFLYTWAEPNFSRTHQRSIAAAQAIRLSNSIADLRKREFEEVMLQGQLVKADLKTGSWCLEFGKELYRGKLAVDPSILDGLTVGNRYTFTCREEIETVGATDRELKARYLLDVSST